MKSISAHLQEILEFAISIVWLGGAFGIAIAGGYEAFFNGSDIKTAVIQSIIVVFFAFVFHEMAHRIVARRYGLHAVYHMWMPGLFISIIAAMLGFIFAAPGGVHLEFSGTTQDAQKKIGLISLMGPLVNVFLSLVFFALAMGIVYFADSIPDAATYTHWLPAINLFWGVFIIGIEIDAWLAVFNLLPFGNFDGFKVFAWSKKIWVVTFVAAIGLYIGMQFAQGWLSG